MGCSPSDPPRDGLSMLEVIVGLCIFMLALVPVVDLLSAGSRIAASSQRLLLATIHAQTLLEAVVGLSSDEMPSDGSTDWVLLEGSGNAAPGGQGRWPQIVRHFSRPPPFEMERLVKAQALDGGRVLVTVEIVFQAHPDKESNLHRLVLRGLTSPRDWT